MGAFNHEGRERERWRWSLYIAEHIDYTGEYYANNAKYRETMKRISRECYNRHKNDPEYWEKRRIYMQRYQHGDTVGQQRTHYRVRKTYTYDGLTLTKPEWAERLGVTISALEWRKRKKEGSIEGAIAYYSNRINGKNEFCRRTQPREICDICLNCQHEDCNGTCERIIRAERAYAAEHKK